VDWATEPDYICPLCCILKKAILPHRATLKNICIFAKEKTKVYGQKI